MYKYLFVFTSIILSDIQLSAQTMYTQGATVQIKNNATLYVQGDLQIQSGSSFQNDGSLEISGNLINNQNMVWMGSGTTTFSGSLPQIISGSSPWQTQHVVFNNPSQITIQNPLHIHGNCAFINGIVEAPVSTSPLLFHSSASLSNLALPSNTSHVNGYVLKEGTGNFTFPVGDGISYQPFTTDLSSNSNGLRVRYHAGNAGGTGFGTSGSVSSPLLAYNTLEYWDAFPIGTAEGIVTLFWDNYNNIGITNANHIKVARLDGSLWQNEGQVSNGQVSIGNVASNVISTWGKFTQGSTSIASPLPISLSAFRGEAKDQSNFLFWTTELEKNNKQFVLQRSTDALHFESIAIIKSKAEEGTSNTSLHYNYEDKDPAILGQNEIFYRLLQEDVDGKQWTSQIVKLSRAEMHDVSLFPNPTSSKVHIMVDKKEIGQMLQLFDAGGKLLMRQKIEHTAELVSVEHLPAGIYFVQVNQQKLIELIKL